MNDERRKQLLRYVDAEMEWPEDATNREVQTLLAAGFVFEDETCRGVIQLTSLGELEIGYPETK